MLLAIAMLASLPEVSRAQCPDNTWTFSTTPQFVMLPGTNCIEEVWYCWKVIGGVVNFQIEFVEPDEWDNCNSLSPSELIIDAIVGFEDNPPNPTNVTIPPCGEGSTTTFEYQVNDCWAVHNSYGQGDPRNPPNPPCYYCTYFGACNGGSSACQTVCQYCLDPATDKIVEQSCSSTNIWNGDCTDQAPNLLAQWIPEQCYDINPCGH